MATAESFSVRAKHVNRKNGKGRYSMKPALLLFFVEEFFHKITESDEKVLTMFL